MDPTSSIRLPGRLVPAGGGHVPVRVRGFVEADAPPGALPSGRRFPVGLARSQHDVVKVVDGDAVLGYLPEPWSRVVDFELWCCEQAGERAVARAVLEGVAGERDLFVMLSWRRGGA
ncbi:hypothetical protein [Cellulomonas fengjieae]|uniref:HIRAN domain-containing protein n=1 Tax=Cellulomonas fengjieae TaxID=2819978 RepID=A0ABS3SKJ0_9CELL|nr:hypothetical protein [Cellulomonas fengjieae]MBO3086261.1 hypothetical protein [Cellulomonas fengjieae]MBO3102333.1 hypothetical protein [Cellulomonas fengjieae]QVI65694.1 hypothetical protein KG102_16650 [Cellulomonas fengjieae]